MSIKILEIPFVNIKSPEILSRVEEAFSLRQNIRIATVNPEFLLEATGNSAFQRSLLGADIRTVDGVGIRIIAWLFGTNLSRVTGADLLLELLRFAESQDIPLTIYNQQRSLSAEDDIRDALGRLYPKLKICYNKELPEYSLVICSYGAPEQELFLDILSAHGIKMGVGGALDYLTGRKKRAPRVFRLFGLEWLWRLILQPRRIKRIFRAVIVFPLRAILDILKSSKESYGR
ncbi:MAG: WecB/TagA/CpsF family glycosyltransferase [Candidatus Moranbacteria bacterium]|nr:WecB/TagA/CpsF family glycosyltransferase [Candidatus Moranbacteria bacterium]